MDKQLNMFDGTKYDKVNQAIKLIQEFEEASKKPRRMVD